MAKITMVLEDVDDGITLNIEVDPPPRDGEEFTNAHLFMQDCIQLLRSKSEAPLTGTVIKEDGSSMAAEELFQQRSERKVH